MTGSLAFAGWVLPTVLLWVGFSDLLYRRIANRLVLGLLVLWLMQLAWLGLQGSEALSWPGIARGVLAAAIVLIVGYGLFAMHWAGAGDVKLVAVLCLWMGNEVSAFLVVTSLAGGVLALGLPLLRRIERFLAARVSRLGTWLHRPLPTPLALSSHTTPGIPYGFAIAAGAAFVLFHG
ncbi:prepilin peptidase [Cupriavidus sp. 2SB]|uniref:A24 family peptidase n=1 Tax=Cupriavidus sp. 2SB TaxID=2502199 RepID=UPI0010F56630|nr:prepilin peptidase [Cupriavidus sp. 2SB]